MAIKKVTIKTQVIGIDLSVLKCGICIIEGKNTIGIQLSFKNSKKKGEYLKVEFYSLGSENPYKSEDIYFDKLERKIFPSESVSRLSSSQRGQIMGEFLSKLLKNEATYGIIELPSIGSINNLMSISRAFGGFENAISENNIELYGFTPTKLKKMISGSGHASKEVLKEVMEHITGGLSFPTDDMVDAFLFAYYSKQEGLAKLIKLCSSSKGR